MTVVPPIGLVRNKAIEPDGYYDREIQSDYLSDPQLSPSYAPHCNSHGPAPVLFSAFTYISRPYMLGKGQRGDGFYRASFDDFTYKCAIMIGIES